MEQVETYVQAQPKETEHPVINSCLETARQIEVQDIEIDEHGRKKLRSGLAKERQISLVQLHHVDAVFLFIQKKNYFENYESAS